ncbi:MAG: hypothetical protein N4A45_01920 [Flavobacteriales bacterium]|jgi:hypothetical protein|nr:hypothetical protein [Flavobacteriales bacterium]
MKPSSHCQICDLQKFNFEKGYVCRLTNKKPVFVGKCKKIKLNHQLKERLFEVNGAFDELQRTRKNAFLNFGVFVTMGFLVLLFLFYLFTSILGVPLIYKIVDSEPEAIEVVFRFFAILVIVGVYLILIGNATMNFYRQQKKTVLPKKNELDKLTEMYQIPYKFHSKIKQFYTGEKIITSHLKYRGRAYSKEERR